MAALILFSNATILLAVLKNRQLRRSLHYRLVLGLGVSDGVVGLALCIIALLFTRGTFYSCVCMLYLVHVSQSASIMQIALISLERILALQNKKLVYPHVWFLSIWIISLVFGSIPLIWTKHPDEFPRCTILGVNGDNFRAYLYISVYFLIVYMLALSSFVYLLVSLNLRLRHMHRLFGKNMTLQPWTNTTISTIAVMGTSNRIHRSAIGEATMKVKNHQYKMAVISIASIMALLTICALPYFLLTFVNGVMGKEYRVGALMRNFFFIPYLFNSALNPLIYIWRFKDYKDALCFWKRDHRVGARQ